MKRACLTLGTIAAAMVLAQPASAIKAPEPPFSVPLVINESLPGFVLPQPTLQIPKGVAKFTTIVPKSAKGNHGIGVDGGRYSNIKGAYVAPGRSSSLTIGLTPGDYTVFDSYKSNRSKGYAVKIHVTHAPAKHVSYGKRCYEVDAFGFDFGFGGALWVKDVTCSSGSKLRDVVEEKWAKSGYSYAPIAAREFNCIINPVSAVGLKFTCIAGAARVTWTG